MWPIHTVQTNDDADAKDGKTLQCKQRLLQDPDSSTTEITAHWKQEWDQNASVPIPLGLPGMLVHVYMRSVRHIKAFPLSIQQWHRDQKAGGTQGSAVLIALPVFTQKFEHHYQQQKWTMLDHEAGGFSKSMSVLFPVHSPGQGENQKLDNQQHGGAVHTHPTPLPQAVSKGG